MIYPALNHYMLVSAALFAIGLYGVLSRRNAVGVLMSIELLLNAVNIALVAMSRYLGQYGAASGQVFAIFVITVAAAEASVALALLIAVYRSRGGVDVESVNSLQG